MPAQILTLQDEQLTIGSDKHIGPFDLGDLNTETGLKAILLFRVQVDGAMKLTMQFNDHFPVVKDHPFDPGPDSMSERSWHENFVVTRTAEQPPNAPPNLKKHGNMLHISATGSGRVLISDIDLIYHAT